jgi:hypothetical protein
VKIAIEAATEKSAKSKSKIFEPVNQLTTVSDDTSLENKKGQANKVLCIKMKPQSQQQWKPSQMLSATSLPPSVQNHQYNKHQRVGNGVRGACYFCNRIGHKYNDCRLANPNDKQTISNRIEAYKNLKNSHRSNPLNSQVATPNPQDQRH